MKELRTAKARIIYDGEYFIRIFIDENASLEKNDIIEINLAKLKLAGENKHVVIFIPGSKSEISREARTESSKPEVYKNAIAKAIIVKSIAHRLIGTFFIGMNKPPAPTKLFSDEKSAVKWLKSMIRKSKLESV